MRTHYLETTRTARYHTLGDAEAGEHWYLLHGYGQSAHEFLMACCGIAERQRLLVAPEGLSRFYLRRGGGPVGASWMTREDREHEIRDLLRYLAALGERVSPQPGTRLCLLGFSQGAAAAWRWAALGERRFERLVAWGSDVPPDLDLQAARERLAGTRIEIVRGDDDEWIDARAACGARERLAALGLDARLLGFAGDHRMDPDTLASLVAG